MATKKSSFAKTGTCYTWSILGQESRYTLKPSKKYTPGALRLASLTSYQLFGGKVASYTWIYLRCLAFNRFCLKIELIRGHTLLFLYPLHERHHLRARSLELAAIDCSNRPSKWQIKRQVELRLFLSCCSVAHTTPHRLLGESYTLKVACKFLHCARTFRLHWEFMVL